MGLAEPLQWKWKGGRVGVPAERLAAAHDAFLVGLDESALAADPDDIEALSRLGETYTRMGRHADGLAIDQRLVVLRPDDETAHYNLACSYALTGKPDEAFGALEAAMEHGYRDAAHLLADDDLAALHDDPRFDELVARLRR